MGTSQSSRRVVVEDGETTGVVKISESVVKRIRGQVPDTKESSSSELPSKCTVTTQTSPACTQLDKEDDFYRQSWKELEERFVGKKETAGYYFCITCNNKINYSPIGKRQLRDYANYSDDIKPTRNTTEHETFNSHTPVNLLERGKSHQKIYTTFSRTKYLNKANAELQRITNEQFAKAVVEVEKKFLKHTSSPVCQNLQSRVYECYLSNRNQILNCAAEVRAFSTCVERARQNALFRKG